MADFDVVLYDRSFSIIPNPRARLSVVNYSHAAMGGPDRATLTIDGEAEDLTSAFDWLRYAVEIRHAESGLAVWWGYVESVVIRFGSIAIGVSLREMANNVAVAYSYIDPTTSTFERRTTTWTGNSESQTEYGVKDMLRSRSGMSDAQAQALRDRVLAARAYPRPTVKATSQGSAATVICRGWWHTLAWRYWQVTATGSVDTGTQMANIATTAGQFFTRHVISVTGISSSQQRDGDATALTEMEALIEAGNSAGDRLRGWVDANRVLRVEAEPASTDNASTLHWRTDGRFERLGAGIVPAAAVQPGVWLRVDIPAAETLRASPVYIERTEYDARADRVRIYPRDERHFSDMVVSV